VAVPAKAIGDPARSRMLVALLGGLRLPAGELARAAGVAPSTGSEHLRLLIGAGLVRVESSGRHRYYSLAGNDVARAMEALQAIAPPIPVRSLRQHRIAEHLKAGRSCYDHLAGDLGLRVTDLLQRTGMLPALEPGQPAEPADPLPQHPIIEVFAIADVPQTKRRPFAKGCLDWTGRRPHVAGALGRHLLALFHSREWVTARTGSRALRLTETGESVLRALENA
jgi:DNA-binding transcriptional ArsR family regulator